MFRRWQLVTVMLLSVIACRAQAQDANTPKHPAQPPVPAMGDDTTSKKPATADPNYVIGAQDVLDVSVWKEPEVSRIVPVRPDGKISLPLLNDVQAAGLTPAQLAQ